MKKACHSAIGGSATGGNNSAFCSPGRSALAWAKRSGEAWPAEPGILHSSFSSAFTLIELLITIVLVGIVLLALIMSFQESLKSMGRQRDLQKAVVLSEDLMNEIRSKYFIDPQPPPYFGPEEDAVRRLFDDVDDYADWSETPPQTVEGTAMSNFTGFTRSVFVVNVPTNNFNAAPVPDNSTDFKRITVVVSNAQISVSNVSVVSLYDNI